MVKLSQRGVCLFLFILLSLAAGSASAEEQQVWPLESKLMVKDLDVGAPDTWVDVGDVSMWNTRDDLNISIAPNVGYKIKKVSIHAVQDPADFASILDKKGKPKISTFAYQLDYLDDLGYLEESHQETISLSEFDEICWGVNPEKCPPNLYIIVHAELQQESTIEVAEGVYETVWVDLPDDAYASNPGVFDRFVKENDVIWGYYVTYPRAKIESGHFVDANVNGLSFLTPTQSGTTGDNGQFWYIPDEYVDFSVGGQYLGTALGDRGVSPADLFEGADMDDPRVINVAWLLQSLDADGNPGQGSINITEEVVACLDSVLESSPGMLVENFADDDSVGALISATQAACADIVDLASITRDEAWANLVSGQKAGNLVKKNISKTPGMISDKAKIEIMPVYVPARRSDGTATEVTYHDADGKIIETRDVAKPIIVSYLDEADAVTRAMDVFVAISRDDGETWKRSNISRTADKTSLVGYPGESQKPMLKVKDNMIFVAWTDKFCRGGRPGYAITVCADTDGDGVADPCEVCRDTSEGTICTTDYPGDDAYWQDDIFGVGGPQRSVLYEEYTEMGEVPYSCVWTSRGVIDTAGEIQWFKPERLTSGRRDAFQLFAGAGEDVAFAIVWQEDPKGLIPGEGDGPGDGWSGANTHNKSDIWYSYITLNDFAKIDYDYPAGGLGGGDDIVDTDSELAGRMKALVPMSLPVRITDNEVCSSENMDPNGGGGEHDFDGEGEGTHRYCGTIENIGTPELPGSNPLCAYTIEKANPNGEIHHVCVTADGRLLDGNTGASRPNIFLQPYKKPDGSKSAWAIIGYEESKGVGTPPDGEHDDDSCGTDTVAVNDESDEHDDDRYKPDMGKNVIYHSFDFANPEIVGGGGILNLPETDAAGTPVYLVDEFGALLLDWKGEPQLAYENARRIRFIPQPKSKMGASGTVLVALYRQGAEGSGKPADIFMRSIKAPDTGGNPYAFGNFRQGASNLSSVEPTELFQDPYDPEAPVKMLRWGWTPANLTDSSSKNPYTDARAHRGALNGDELIIGYSWTPNWGRRANDKYDLYIRRSFDGGQNWTTDPKNNSAIEHNVVFRVPVEDDENQAVIWDEEVVTTVYEPGDLEPPRNVSNLRNNRTSVLEPRLVKTPGTITTLDGSPTGYPEDSQDTSAYQLAYGLEFNQNQLPDGVVYPKIPLDIYYSRTMDKGQRYESVIVTPQGGSGKPEEGWNPLAKDTPQQGAVQVRQTPDGSRMYGIWLEESDKGSDIMFRRVDYR